MAIAVIEPSSSGIALVAAAKKLGKAVYILSADTGDRRLSEAVRQGAEAVIRVETTDPQAVLRAAAQLARQVRLEAVLPGFEYMVDLAAHVAGQLGLPGLSPRAAQRTRNKFSLREALRGYGLAVPAYTRIEDAGDLDRAARRVGFPAVLKPVDACGSLLVQRVDSLPGLRQAYREASGNPLRDMGRAIGNRMMLESYVPGREFSLEGMIDAQGPRVLAVTEKLLGPEPFFVELGHVVEAALAAPERAALVRYVKRAIHAIGLTRGVFHAEARLGPQGPVLIEVAARLGGDRIYRLVEIAKQVSLPELMIRSYCAESPLIGDAQPAGAVAGVRFLTLGAETRFHGVEGADRVRQLPGFEELELYYGPGEDVPRLTDFRGRVGHVLFRAPDRATLEARLTQATALLRFAGLPQDTARGHRRRA